MYHVKKNAALVAAALAIAAISATGATAHNKPNPKYKWHNHFHHHHQKHKHTRSLKLEAQGSYFVGGEIVTIPSRVASGEPQPGDISINHAYVQYQIPEDQKYRFPIVMVHGGGHTGKTYETTPDGREGWYTSFTRRGFATYAIDDPNRGRACCEPTELHMVRLGLMPPNQLPNMNIYTYQQSYATFRFGPAYPEAYPDTLFPVDALEQYAPQWVLTYRDAEENAKITNAIIATMESTGPGILMLHSQSGSLGLAAVIQRPDLFKAVVAAEPVGFSVSTADAPKLKNIPILTLFGDHLDTTWTNALAQAQTSATNINAIGGNMRAVHLPAAGIKGNSHMMMMDKNNERLADMIEDWVKRNVKKVK